MTGERCHELELSPMVPAPSNKEAHGTAFTGSVEARAGTSMGISAADRGPTAPHTRWPHCQADAYKRPGHQHLDRAGDRLPTRARLAIPLIIALATAVAAKAGILVKDRLDLERIRSIGMVLFDKTGTPTKGAHTLHAVVGTEDKDEQRVLRIAAAVEADSEHPTRSSDGHGGRRARRRPSVSVPCCHRPRCLGRRRRRPDRVGGPSTLTDSVTGWEQRGAAVLYLTTDAEIVGAHGTGGRGPTKPPGSR